MAVKVKIKKRALLILLATRNMSQNGLARVAGLKGGHVSQLINGDRNVSPVTRERLLKAMQPVKFEDIFTIIPDE
jgi:transcriptional regulator with XRE-family HTH domain